MTYGFQPGADVRAEEVTQQGGRMQFSLCLPDGTRTPVTLALPGRPNVKNPRAAAAGKSMVSTPAPHSESLHP